MLVKLPLEIQIKLLLMVPNSNLKFVNSHFYLLYNDLYYHKIVNTFGEATVKVIIKILPWLKPYIKSLDVFRKQARLVITKRLQLEELPIIIHNSDFTTTTINPLNCQYIKDSWKYIYSILKNKRLYAEYCDYQIDEPSNYVFNHYVEINRTYLLSYKKVCWLTPGDYNLNIALAIKNGQGLGTTKFEVRYQELNELGETLIKLQTFYPPSNINEILPKNQFVYLNVGHFIIPKTSKIESKFYSKQFQFQPQPNNDHNKLRRIEIVMEEIGLYLKSGFRVYFIDISQPSMLFNEYDLLYYSINETDYRYFINILLKNLYKALNYVQNAGCSDDLSFQYNRDIYGDGDPFIIIKKYDKQFLLEYEKTNGMLSSSSSSSSSSSLALSSLQDYVLYDNKKLLNYGRFFFLNKFTIRNFKFTTIYQQRQFINRFGDYLIDWKEQDSKKNTNKDEMPIERNCTYDKYGLKWKLPILGQL